MPIPDDLRILALGSPHGDDQVAWSVAANLANDPQLATRVFRVTSPWNVLDHLANDRRVIVMDACCGGGSPGNLIRLGPQDLDRLPNTRRSTHGGSLAEVLRLAQALGRTPAELILLAVEIGATDPVADMTEPARDAVRVLERSVRSELQRLENVTSEVATIAAQRQ